MPLFAIFLKIVKTVKKTNQNAISIEIFHLKRYKIYRGIYSNIFIKTFTAFHSNIQKILEK